MKLLLACGGGMSSSLLAENLVAEAKKNGNDDFSVQATGTESVALNLQQDTWDALLLAPQVSFRKGQMEKEAGAYGIPVIPIEGIMYTPMGAPKLYKAIMAKLAK